MSATGLGDWFARSSTQASSNYGIGYDGKVGLYVDEGNRSWCSSSAANDQRAITIECASSTVAPAYAVNDVVYNRLIELCIDICKRHKKTKLLWLGGTGSTALDRERCENYTPAENEMILTAHRFYCSKSCPGEYLYTRFWDIAAKVTAALTPTEESTPATASPTEDKTITAGAKLTLSKEPLYVSSTAKTASSTISGTYYFWGGSVINGRIRITNAASRVGIKGQVTGWINSPAKYYSYTVKKGDTLSKIASACKVQMSKIIELNNIKNPNLIYVGQIFKIPIE